MPEKVMRFQGKNRDLSQLAQQIVQQLQVEGYKMQWKAAPLGIVIQAQKAGILRDIITADRAFTILATGQPDDFTIHIGIGRWIQNIAVAAAEAILLSWLFLAIDVPEMLWTRHVEEGLAKEITQMAEAPSSGAPAMAAPQPGMTVYCNKCGIANPADAKFCRNCGAEIKPAA